MTDEEAWELAERLNAKAPEGVSYAIRRTQGATGRATPWYVARVGKPAKISSASGKGPDEKEPDVRPRGAG